MLGVSKKADAKAIKKAYYDVRLTITKLFKNKCYIFCGI